jgi:hypothetical protein
MIPAGTGRCTRPRPRPPRRRAAAPAAAAASQPLLAVSTGCHPVPPLALLPVSTGAASGPPASQNTPTPALLPRSSPMQPDRLSKPDPDPGPGLEPDEPEPEPEQNPPQHQLHPTKLRQQQRRHIVRVIDLPKPNVPRGVRSRSQRPSASVAFVVKGLLTPSECEHWIRRSEERGYVPATLGEGQVRPRFRSSQRNMLDSPELAGQVFRRLHVHLPKLLDGRKLCSLNERLRFLRYDSGERFQPHQDGVYTRPDNSESSRLTLMLYLNDGGGADFDGGETNFLLMGPRRHGSGRQSKPQKGSPQNLGKASVVPCAGDALVFSHGLLHEGAAVVQGRKYCVRTDVMYENFRH